MTQEQFENACWLTQQLLQCAVEYKIEPARLEEQASSPAHLAWMLMQAVLFHAEGKVEKANRWLGYVQGSMHADGYAKLDDLKRANMPEGETFDPEKV